MYLSGIMAAEHDDLPAELQAEGESLPRSWSISFSLVSPPLATS
jgi:hypothetical protein